jgi:cytochrome c oxidase subunit 2
VNPLVSTSATVDPIFLYIFGACLALLIGITLTMAYFVVRYHRSRAPQPTSQNEGNIWLEIIWIVLPTLLVLAMFYYGWIGYLALRTAPKDAITVTATARKWSWTFTYPGGKTSSKLYVPVGIPVKVELVSQDVIHGFYLPAFRVKRDVVPGMKNFAWFVATEVGSSDLFCSQYCGTGHSAMITTVEALPKEQFEAFLKKEHEQDEHEGRELLEKYGCLGCHSLDGTAKVGPGFKGIAGRTTTVVTNGAERVITVDDTYLRRSIREPNADIVKGFQPIMPPFELEEKEMKEIIEYLKTLK